MKEVSSDLGTAGYGVPRIEIPEEVYERGLQRYKFNLLAKLLMGAGFERLTVEELRAKSSSK